MHRIVYIVAIFTGLLLNSCAIFTTYHTPVHEVIVLNKEFRQDESNSDILLGALGLGRNIEKKPTFLNTSAAIYCYIMSDIYSVEKINNNSVLLKEDAVFSMRTANVQQYYADFTMRLRQGTGAKFNLRTTKDKFSLMKGLELTVSTNGIYFSENGIVTKNFAGHHLKEGETYRLIIKNHGKYVKVSLDCVDFPEYEIKLPLTEFTIVSTEKNSVVELSAVSFSNVYSD